METCRLGAEEITSVTAEELTHATLQQKMKESEADKHKQLNERLERELYLTKHAYDLVKNNDARRRDEPTRSNESAHRL